MGLVSAPRLRFLKKFNIKQETAKNSFITHGSGSESDDDDDLLKPKGAPELPSLVVKSLVYFICVLKLLKIQSTQIIMKIHLFL